MEIWRFCWNARPIKNSDPYNCMMDKSDSQCVRSNVRRTFQTSKIFKNSKCWKNMCKVPFHGNDPNFIEPGLLCIWTKDGFIPIHKEVILCFKRECDNARYGICGITLHTSPRNIGVMLQCTHKSQRQELPCQDGSGKKPAQGDV